MGELEARALRRWADEPLTFVRQCIGAEPDPWQAVELQKLPQHDRIAVAGSKGCAKTAFEAWVIWWTLTTQRDCNVAAVSTSGDNLRDGLWKELAKWHVPLLQELFHWSPERIVRKTRPGTWFASARKYSRDADPTTQGNALAGLHGDAMLFVIDEAGLVPPAVLATADAVLATKQPGHKVRVLIGGNTNSQSGSLYVAVVKQRGMWHLVRITSDPDDPLRTPRVSADWARQQIAAYGRDNPWVKINVFAEFPDVAIGKLVSLTEIEAAESRQIEENLREPLILGQDVGTVVDAAVSYPRRGRLLYAPLVLRGKSTIAIAGEGVNRARELGAVTTFVDAGGPGIGVFDQMRALGLQCVPVYFGGGADDSLRYANKRIEMYERFATWIKEGGAITRCPELVQDLLEPEISWNNKGQKIMEPKDDVAARLGRSPDWGDGAALTFAYPVAAPPVTPSTDPTRPDLWRPVRPESWDEFGFGGQS